MELCVFMVGVSELCGSWLRLWRVICWDGGRNAGEVSVLLRRRVFFPCREFCRFLYGKKKNEIYVEKNVGGSKKERAFPWSAHGEKKKKLPLLLCETCWLIRKNSRHAFLPLSKWKKNIFFIKKWSLFRKTFLFLFLFWRFKNKFNN